MVYVLGTNGLLTDSTALVTQTGAIKIGMVGTQNCWCQFKDNLYVFLLQVKQFSD